MSDNQNRIPSFDEVMGKDTQNGKVPSFEDIMGEEPPVKKKVSGNEPKFGGIVGTYAPQSEESKIAKALQTVKSSPATEGDVVREAKYKAVTSPKLQVTQEEFDEDPVSVSRKVILSKMPSVKRYDQPKSAEQEDKVAEFSFKEGDKEIENVKKFYSDNTNSSIAHLSKITGISNPDLLYSDEFDERIKSAVKPGNETDRLAYERLQDAKKARAVVRENLEQGKSFEDMAIDYAAANSPEMAKVIQQLKTTPTVYEVMGGVTSVNRRPEEAFDEATIGRFLYDFYNSSAVRQEMEKIPGMTSKVVSGANQLIQKYPSFGKMYLGNLISQKMEDMGMNNAVLNVATKKERDKAVEALVAEDKMSPLEVQFYKDNIRNLSGLGLLRRKVTGNPIIDTPGALESAAGGAYGGFKNTIGGLYELTGLRESVLGSQGALRQDLEKTNTQVSVKPKGIVNQIAMNAGQFFGQSMSIGAGGKMINNIKLAKDPMTVMGMVGATQAYANYLPQARMMFPGNELKQKAYAFILSGIEWKTEKIFNDRKVVDGLLGKLKPSVVEAIKDFTEKKISSEAARANIQSAIRRAIKDTPEAAKYFGKAVVQNDTEELSAELGGQVSRGIFENKPFDEWIDGEDLYETTKAATLGSPIIGSLSARADMQKNRGITAKTIYSMAQDPDYWKAQIMEGAKLDETLAAEAPDKIKNLEIAAKIVQELAATKLTEKQKVKFVITELEKQLKTEQSKDAAIQAIPKAAISELEKVQQDILDGKDDGSIEGDKSDDVNPDEKKLFDMVVSKAKEGYKETLKAAETPIEGLEYLEDKYAENPVKFREDFGDDIADKIGERTSTEKLESAIDFLIQQNPDDPAIPVLDKLISEREQPLIDQIRELDMGSEPLEVSGSALKDVGDTFENREAIEDNLKDLGDDVYYHGSDDISYLSSKEDFNTVSNTKNAESKYVNLTPKAGTAVSYSIRQQRIGEKSGVAAFKLKGKGYTMTNADIKTLKSNADYEAFYDKKKSEGYDFVKVPQDANDIVVLNNNAIEYVGKKFNKDALTKAPPQYTEAATPKVEGGQTVETTIPKNETTQEATKATESIPTIKEPSAKEKATEDSGGAKEPPKTPTEGKGVGEGGSGKRDLDKLANNVPETGKVAEYMSKDSIIDATGEAPTNDQKRGVQSLEIALEHGEKIIDKAKELYGDDYVEKTLDYIENSTAAVSNKALMYVSLENALGKEKLTNPDKAAEITKKQALVYSKSQLFARENSKALNYNKLRNIAKVGYDVSKITDSFFSADELVSKNEISKAIEADADTINKEAELQETGGITPEIEKAINEGVAKEVQKIYEALPKEKKTAADRAIAALEKAQAKLRNKTYDAGLGIPVAFIDAGITTIKLAIKAGVKIADAIELGIAKIKEKYGKEIEKEREDAIRKDLAEVFDKAKSTKDLVKTILIEKGFGRKFVKKGETKVTLDWKKLAGAAGTTSKISENVADALKDKGYSAQEVNEMKDALINEYIDLRASVIEKAQNELARRNKETVTPEQKTAAKKLAELYTYGLFDAKIDEFENTLNKALGAKVSERGFQEAKDIAKAMDTIYSSTFKGVRLSDISAKAAIEKLEDRMRVLLFREAKKQGKWWNLGAANLVRNYFEIQQTMLLNNLKQAMENPFSGLQQNLIDKMVASGASTSEMATQRRKMMKDVYYDMILKGGVGYGKVESQFVNRQHIDDYVNKLSDKKLYHGIASALTGKATLNAMDAMFKAGITEKKFAGNLIKILTHSSNPNKMTREEAVKFVSEKLTGQTFDEAKETAKGIIEKINEDAGKELVSPNEYQVNRFANDIVKSALEMGNKITKEQIEAAYNAAYKAAGLGLGHEANNILSSTIKGYSAKLEGDINRAIKDKEFNRAAMLTYKSILFRNVLNPFVGGGTNWLVLKLEKTGLGLFTGLAYQIGSKGRIDVGSEIGMKRLEARLYNQSRYKDNYMRGLVGGMTSLLVYAAFLQLADEDEYRKWRRKNKWAAKYLDVITPEYLLAEMAAKDGKVKQYAASSFNKNDAFDASTKIIKAIEYFSKGDRSKGWGAMGEAMGQKINAPLPWRLVKDGQVIYQGVKGQDPYHGNYQPSEGFLSGVLQGGSIEYLGYRPVSPVTTMYTPEDMESPEIKFFIDKDVKMPSPNIDSKEIESSDGKTLMKLKDADKATQEKYVAAYKKYLKEGLLELKKGYIEVYQDSFGRVSIPSTEEGQKGKETILLKDLDQKQLQSVVSDLGGMATKKASEEVFPKN